MQIKDLGPKLPANQKVPWNCTTVTTHTSFRVFRILQANAQQFNETERVGMSKRFRKALDPKIQFASCHPTNCRRSLEMVFLDRKLFKQSSR